MSRDVKGVGMRWMIESGFASVPKSRTTRSKSLAPSMVSKESADNSKSMLEGE